ncbi:MAG: dTDP-4-dehydrorhamnose 3,5-epimerase [Chlamydiia bacterium]|nr:dTDP-4-dehydrorhamnose 3,5-epimerase [Chlamydiia bacterium]MCP5506628.1 dTDP-4-dehydrorhamnose 3,5-epimerase [Chlamydiales bacterium]
MKIEDLSLQGVKLISPQVFRDGRGYFLESHQAVKYRALGIDDEFVQDNHSCSGKGVIRGMHFQSKPGQAKLVRVASGQIYDVVVDIRPNSPTFGKWVGTVLDGENHHQLYIPVGFAHGFCVLSDEAHVLYKTSSVYNHETEKGFRFDDPEIGIKWPVKDPIVSERDQQCPYFYELRWS